MQTIRSAAPSDAYFQLINYKPYPYQKAIHECWSLYRTAIIGRQSGKSQAAAAEASFELLTNMGSVGWVVAPTYEQAGVVFERVAEFVKVADRKLPGKRNMRVSNRMMRIVIDHYDAKGAYVGTTKFQGKSAENEDNLRGHSLDYIILDEAAMIDEQVWTAALAPTLTTTNGWVLIITTPKGYNWVYEFYRLGQEAGGDPHAMYASWQLPTWEANPTVPSTFFEQQKALLPERIYLQEYGAQFLSDSGSVFQRLTECPKVPIVKRDADSITMEEFNPMHKYIIGADFARLDDFSVFTVVNATKKRVAKVVRMNTVSWERQLERLKRLHEEYRNAVVAADDQGVGDVLVEQLAAMGLPLEPVGWRSPSAKEAVVNKLALSIEHKRISLPDDSEYLKEFEHYVYEKTPSGQLKMQAAGRGKDDRVASLAMAWFLVDEHSHGGVEVPDDGYVIDLGDGLDALDELSHIPF